MHRFARTVIISWVLCLSAGDIYSQSVPSEGSCGPGAAPTFCSAVRGDRAEGWLSQSRSEVMAQHGMVVTSQPLAAQAGLQILRQGGNAIDAAVASAAVLSLVEPESVGVASDLFAVIYIARDHKLYALNSSGMAPSGATVERMNQLGYHWNPKNFGPMSGMPLHGILTVTVSGAQVIMFVPDASQPVGTAANPLHGYYRGGSDFRKDGQAVGW